MLAAPLNLKLTGYAYRKAPPAFSIPYPPTGSACLQLSPSHRCHHFLQHSASPGAWSDLMIFSPQLAAWVGGKGKNATCIVAPQGAVLQGFPVGLYVRPLDSLPCDTTKPLCRWTRPHPVKRSRTDDKTCFEVELGEPLIRS